MAGKCSPSKSTPSNAKPSKPQMKTMPGTRFTSAKPVKSPPKTKKA